MASRGVMVYCFLSEAEKKVFDHLCIEKNMRKAEFVKNCIMEVFYREKKIIKKG